MFIRLRELTSASCQSMARIAIYVNLYTRIRPRVTSCVTLLGTSLFPNPWLVGFIYGLMIGMGPKFFSVPSPSRSRSRTWKFIVDVYSC